MNDLERLRMMLPSGSNPLDYGDGSDGDLNTSGDVLIPVTTEDDEIIEKNYVNLTINSGHTLTTDKRCKMLIIRCKGNVVIDGILSMTKKGGNSVDAVYKHINGNFILLDSTTSDIFSKGILLTGTGGAGGAGGIDGTFDGNGGAGGTEYPWSGIAGGGGGGGAGKTYTSTKYAGHGGRGRNTGEVFGVAGAGGSNNSGSGGGFCCGGGGAGERYNTSRSAVGGVGGVGYGAGAGGGGGAGCYEDATSNAYGQAGADGEPAGGIILLIAKGTITINSTGKIEANGGNGGNGGNGAWGGGSYSQGGGNGGGGGGGAGGGFIFIACDTLTNSGIIECNGGLGGAGGLKAGPSAVYDGRNGSSGTVGTILIQEISKI